MLVRRRGSGTFVSEPKIAQELTMTSFTEDMRRRGMVPGEPHARAAHRPRRRASRPASPGLAVRAGRRHHAPAARRPRDDGDRDTPRAGVARPGAQRRAISSSIRSTSCSRSATASRSSGLQTIEPTVTNEEESAALGVPAPLAGVRLRARRRGRGSGEIVEYVRSVYRGDRYRLVTELNAAARAGARADPAARCRSRHSRRWSVPAERRTARSPIEHSVRSGTPMPS